MAQRQACTHRDGNLRQNPWLAYPTLDDHSGLRCGISRGAGAGGCWQDPQRSLRKAQQVSQWAASALGFALVGEMSLSRVIARITGAMSKGCRIDSRSKKHNTYQLVRDPTLIHS